MARKKSQNRTRIRTIRLPYELDHAIATAAKADSKSFSAYITALLQRSKPLPNSTLRSQGELLRELLTLKGYNKKESEQTAESGKETHSESDALYEIFHARSLAFFEQDTDLHDDHTLNRDA